MAVIVADDYFKYIFLDEKNKFRFLTYICFSEVQLTISQHLLGAKPLPEPMQFTDEYTQH